MPEAARRYEESYEKQLLEPEELDEYIGEIVIRVSELQAEKARLEGEGAPKKDIADLDREIRSLQVLIRDNQQAFAEKAEREQDAKEKAAQDKLFAKTRTAAARADASRAARRAKEQGALDEFVSEFDKQARTSAERAKNKKTETPGFGLGEAGPLESEAEEALAALEMITPEERTEADIALDRKLVKRTRALVEKAEQAKKAQRELVEADEIAKEFRARLEARKKEREAAERALLSGVVGAMEAGPETVARQEAAPEEKPVDRWKPAPPPENLPVAPEAKAAPAKGAPVSEYTRNIYTRIDEMNARVEAAKQKAKARENADWRAANIPTPKKETAKEEGYNLSTKAAKAAQERFPELSAVDASTLAHSLEGLDTPEAEAKAREDFVDAFEQMVEKTDDPDALRALLLDLSPQITVADARKMSAEQARDLLDRVKVGEWADTYFTLLRKDVVRIKNSLESAVAGSAGKKTFWTGEKKPFFKRFLKLFRREKPAMNAKELIRFQEMDRITQLVLKFPSKTASYTRGSSGGEWSTVYTGRPPR